MNIVPVGLGTRAYNICIGANAAAAMPDAFFKARFCFVTDSNVAPLWLETAQESFAARGAELLPAVVVQAGEDSKNINMLSFVVDKLMEAHADRATRIVALGGGMIGDLAGFAASVFLRGVPLVQMPTSLLAMVDSAVGGKTAVNTPRGKNMIGTFWQPAAVLADTGFLASLPAREVKSAYAEILKYGLLGDAGFYSWLLQNGEKVIARDPESLSYAIAASCRAKAAIVAADEREENDTRALLNLGHTFGHALEALGGYDGRLLHGEAVGIGLLLAARYSAEQKLCDPSVAEELLTHMRALGLVTAPPFDASPAAVVDRMMSDKKNSGGKITLVLLRGIGKAFISRGHDAAALPDFLKRQQGSLL